jgi:hypothetical protein
MQESEISRRQEVPDAERDGTGTPPLLQAQQPRAGTDILRDGVRIPSARTRAMRQGHRKRRCHGRHGNPTGVSDDRDGSADRKGSGTGTTSRYGNRQNLHRRQSAITRRKNTQTSHQPVCQYEAVSFRTTSLAHGREETGCHAAIDEHLRPGDV